MYNILSINKKILVPFKDLIYTYTIKSQINIFLWKYIIL